ncbi:hypothetical protein, partial [Sinorhizobium saheli]|uniref:hypothetical protein n=1 Tax=Sinorhizobium saheli TaxID=36856 RepID=UPI001AEDEB90
GKHGDRRSYTTPWDVIIEGTRALQRHRLAVDVIRFAIAPSLSISMCRILRGVATVSVDLKPPGLARRN